MVTKIRRVQHSKRSNLLASLDDSEQGDRGQDSQQEHRAKLHPHRRPRPVLQCRRSRQSARNRDPQRPPGQDRRSPDPHGLHRSRSRAAAAELNRRVVATPSGAPWSAKTVIRARDRIGLQEKGLTDPQRQSQHAATALSDNQTAAAKKLQSSRSVIATGRRFKF